ncbi:hypothetical protein ACFL27_14080 [candidate division CSSED10-310 bacterium]|uniref:Uncharacterized protein n=1 Tax=candidate division CSSED10-310 bacterium TaxID=2855610 RepID=A0ABV6YYQ1_UNCC1
MVVIKDKAKIVVCRTKAAGSRYYNGFFRAWNLLSLKNVVALKLLLGYDCHQLSVVSF